LLVGGGQNAVDKVRAGKMELVLLKAFGWWDEEAVGIFCPGSSTIWDLAAMMENPFVENKGPSGRMG